MLSGTHFRQQKGVGPSGPDHMDFKRILRGPYIWILLAVVGIFVGWTFIAQSGTQEISTQKGLEQLSDGKVSSAVVNSTEQRVDLTLRNDGGTEQFYYSTPVAPRSSRRSRRPTCPRATTTTSSSRTSSCRSC